MKSNWIKYIGCGILWLLVFAAGVASIVYLTPWLFTYFADKPDNKISVLAQFGESAGVMAAVFAVLAFGAMCWTLQVQIRNDRINHSSEATTEFESVFFHMLDSIEHMVENLSLKQKPTDTNSIKGRDVFRYLYEQAPLIGGESGLSAKQYNGIPNYVTQTGNWSLVDLDGVLFDGTLDHYFRTIYRTLKYVHESPLLTDETQRHEYADILRAHLSSYELLVIFFNCLRPDGTKFKALVEEFAIFNNLRVALLPQDEKYYSIYKNKFKKDCPIKEKTSDKFEYSKWAFQDRIDNQNAKELEEKLRKRETHHKYLTSNGNLITIMICCSINTIVAIGSLILILWKIL